MSKLLVLYPASEEISLYILAVIMELYNMNFVSLSLRSGEHKLFPVHNQYMIPETNT